MAALLLFGLAVFFFIFGALPYWFKLHKNLNEILGCEFKFRASNFQLLTLGFFSQAGP